MKQKLVDPTCLMDAKGRPLSSYEAMEKRIEFLERWVVRLTRMLRRQQLIDGPSQVERSINHSIN